MPSCTARSSSSANSRSQLSKAPSFTFAVCMDCGIQSPPVLVKDNEQSELAAALKAQGWSFDALRFNVLACCPKCRAKARAEV